MRNFYINTSYPIKDFTIKSQYSIPRDFYIPESIGSIVNTNTFVTEDGELSFTKEDGTPFITE